MNPSSSTSTAADFRQGRATVRQLIAAAAIVLFGAGLWLVAMSTFATAPTPYEQTMITTSGAIVLAITLALVSVAAVSMGLALTARWRPCRVVVPIFVGLCLCAPLGDLLVIGLIMSDHLSAVTPAGNAIDNRIAGVAGALLLTHMGAAYAAARAMRSIRP